MCLVQKCLDHFIYFPLCSRKPESAGRLGIAGFIHMSQLIFLSLSPPHSSLAVVMGLCSRRTICIVQLLPTYRGCSNALDVKTRSGHNSCNFTFHLYFFKERCLRSGDMWCSNFESSGSLAYIKKLKTTKPVQLTDQICGEKLLI